MKANTVGILVALIVFAFGVNSALIYLFEYPLVYCIGQALATEEVRNVYSLVYVLAAVFFIGGAIAGGKGIGKSLVRAVAIMFLFALIPVWFETIFFRGGSCG